MMDDSCSCCDKCKRLIDGKNVTEIRFNNRYYHADCFTCSLCNRNLNGSTNNKLKINDDGQPICSVCELSAANICYVCQEPIINEETITFDKNTYHKNCFYCIQCRKSLIDQTNIHIHYSKPCCLTCYNHHFAPQCFQCLKPISDGKCTSYDGNKYHSDCFRCDQCNNIIIDTEFSIHNSKPCCLTCYNHHFAPQCQQCLKPISNGKFLIYNDKKYHPDCFRCHHCNKVIIDIEFPTHNSKPYCIQCYDQYFAPQCQQCLKPIFDGKSIIYNENKYHPDCFRCVKCNKIINNTKFSTYNSKPCCIQCYNDNIAPQCQQCLKPISSGKSIIYNENKYHPDCFRCIKCNKAINDTKFSTYNSKPCCIQCYNDNIAPQCQQCLKSIFEERSIIYDGKTYHPDCFRCGQCNKIINDSKFHRENNKPCCIKCYNNYFTPQCSNCSKPIIDKYTTFQGKKFHIHCFSCVKCHQIIDKEDKFYNNEEGILCSTCAL